MRAVVSIIGTSHEFQFGGAARTENQNRAFETLVRQTCMTRSIRCLAEEMSRDALQARDLALSTVEEIARDLRLVHIYCDPSVQEQETMGLRVERNSEALKRFENWSDEQISRGTAAEHRQRERFWLEKLLENGSWPCLFICGAEHAAPFRKLLTASNVQADLVEDAWDA